MDKLLLPLIGFSLVSLLFVSSPVLALNSSRSESTKITPTGKPERNREQSGEALTGAKLKVCENKQETIKTRLRHLNELINVQYRNFDRIAVRIEEFYTTKITPTGKTVPNYNALVADIAAKKAAVKTALDKTQADADAFDCKNSGPKQVLEQYRLHMQAVKTALREYRQSVKALSAAVRSAAQTVRKETTPKPTKAED